MTIELHNHIVPIETLTAIYGEDVDGSAMALIPEGGLGVPVLTYQATAGENMGGHRAVSVRADGLAWLADAADADPGVYGLSTVAVALGETVTIQFSGLLTVPGATWAPGQALWVGADGLLTQACPTSGWAMQIGSAISSTKIHINSQSPMYL